MSRLVHVEKGFTLNLGGGQPAVVVGPGIQPLPDEIADHWYAKLHFAGGGVDPAQYARSSRDGTDAQFVKAKEAFALYVALEATTLDAETSAGVEPTEPSFTRLEGWPDTDPVTEAYDKASLAFEDAKEKPPAAEKPARGGRAK